MITWITPTPCSESRSDRTKANEELVQLRSGILAGSNRVWRQVGPGYCDPDACVPHIQLPREALEEAGHSAAIDRLRQKASGRLRRFCANFSAEQFETLIHDVTRSEFVHGFKGAEKESRIRLFETFYRSVE